MQHQEKSFLQKFKIKVSMIALGLDVLTVALASFLPEAKVEYVYGIMGSITALAAMIISAHSKVDAEAVKLVGVEIAKETAEIYAGKTRRK